MLLQQPSWITSIGKSPSAEARRGAWFLGALAFVAIVVPVLNQLVPPTSSFHLSAYALTLIGKYMCYAMLAMAVDLIWGYCGILSLGHAAFFSLGGYAMGMYLMRQIGTRGVYGDPILPDFMVFLNWKSLPWFWYGFNHFHIRSGDDVHRSGAARNGVRMVCVSIARHRCVFFDHHPGAQLCPDARVLPKRYGLRRQQRVHRFQGDPGI